MARSPETAPLVLRMRGDLVREEALLVVEHVHVAPGQHRVLLSVLVPPANETVLRIRIGIQPKMLDPDPYQMDTDPQS